MMHARKRTTDLVRRIVAARQQWKCAMCEHLLSAYYQIDHVRPLFLGGSNHNDNLQALCANCHAEKTATERGGGGGHGISPYFNKNSRLFYIVNPDVPIPARLLKLF